MIDAIVQWLNNFPPALATVILSALPITELRLTIPIAIQVWLMQPLEALGWAIVGNCIPFFPLYYGLNSFRKWSERHTPWLTKFIDASVDRAQTKVKEKYARYGALALFLFTAIPLPLTGLWSATLAAVALKVPVKYAFFGIAGGVVAAGIIVTILSVGADVLF